MSQPNLAKLCSLVTPRVGCWVPLGKLLQLSLPQFAHLLNGDSITTSYICCKLSSGAPGNFEGTLAVGTTMSLTNKATVQRLVNRGGCRYVSA